uniref:GGDEF domain-containing protein n=1 Tax=Dictyoglomus thermophilum TaxID=14 RepID=A0A7C3RVY8_DICTH
MRKKIGVIVNYLYEGYQMKILSGIFSEAEKLNTDIYVFVGGDLNPNNIESQRRNRIYDLISKKNMDGLIILGLVVGFNLPKEEIIKFYKRFYPQLPVVSLGLETEEIPCVISDNRKGFQELLIHLIEDHRYRSIAYVAGPINNEEAQIRNNTFYETLREYDIEIKPEYIYESDFTTPQGIYAIRTFLDERKIKPDVIVFSNDNMAIAGLEELKRRKIKVPNEIAITGFDNILESTFVEPSLSTVEQNLSELGKKALEMCHSLILGKEIPKKIEIPTKMTIRESCGCTRFYIRLSKKEEKVWSKIFDLKKDKEDFYSLLNEYLISNIETKSPRNIKWIKNIIKKFYNSVIGTEENFITEIESLLLNNNVDTELLEETFNNINSFIDMHFENSLHQKAKNLILQSINVLKDYKEKKLKHEIFKTNDLIDHLGYIGADLLSTLQMDEILNRVSYRLPEIDLNTFYIFMYQKDSNYKKVKNILSVVDGNIKTKEKGIFDIEEIIPESLLPKRRLNLVLEPLFVENDHLGYIVFEYGPKKGVIYEILRAEISGGIKGALIIEELKKLAITDPLTSLPNRRALDEILQREIERSKRYNRPLSVMVIDLDNFKMVNDTFGHSFGDEVLKTVGKILRESCRKVDIVGRYGGDEFIIILPETNLKNTIKVANKLIKNVDKIELFSPNKARIYLSISIGIAVYPDTTIELEKLINFADLAMYEAKSLGGKQYSIISFKGEL